MRLLVGTLTEEGLITPERRLALVNKDFVSPELYQKRVLLLAEEVSPGLIRGIRVLETLGPVSASLIERLLEEGELKERDLLALCGLEKRPLCALVIGHKKSSPGAVNPRLGLSEFEFNENLALLIERLTQGVEVQRIYRRTYASLPEDINALAPDFVVSLHCNAFNGQASGTEVLYYHRSRRGKLLAEIIQRRLVGHLGLPDRGLKPCTAEDRGGYLLRYTKAPCVICEPFFIDNDQDLARAQEDLEGLALAYAQALDEAGKVLFPVGEGAGVSPPHP